jgi:cytochrome c-type biogenesis protein CcmH
LNNPVFWSAVFVMLAVALLLVLPPLLRQRGAGGLSRRDANVDVYRERLAELEAELTSSTGEVDEQVFEEATQELKRSLLADAAPEGEPGSNEAPSTLRPANITACILASTLPFAALLIYLNLGEIRYLSEASRGADPALASAGSRPVGQPPGMSGGATEMPPIEQMVARLEARLSASPKDLEGWMLLVRTFSEMSQFEQARISAERGLVELPENPDLLVAYAEALARQSGNILAGTPIKFLDRALAKDSRHPKALWLSGIGALHEGRNEEALAHWKVLRSLGPMSPEEEQLLAQFEAQAGARPATAIVENPAKPEPAMAATTPGGEAASDQETDGISVLVNVTAGLADRIAPGNVLFVFARAANGPRMPLAIARLTADELPVSVRLDDSMAMMPALKLSGFDQVVVGARVSKTGNAMPSSGDLFGETDAISPAGTSRVSVSINQIVP